MIVNGRLFMNKITNSLCLSLLFSGIAVFGMDHLAWSQHEKLLEAAKSGWCDEVQRLIAQRVPVDVRNNDGRTPLMLAVQSGHIDVCKLLITNQASLEVKDGFGISPLNMAAIRGHEAVCRLLIESKASIDAGDSTGCTPLFNAVFCNHENTCKLLIDVQLEQARKNKAAIVTFLGIAKKRKQNFPSEIPFDVAQMIAREALKGVRQEKQHVIDQVHMMDKEKQDRWLKYVNPQMNTPIK